MAKRSVAVATKVKTSKFSQVQNAFSTSFDQGNVPYNIKNINSLNRYKNIKRDTLNFRSPSAVFFREWWIFARFAEF